MGAFRQQSNRRRPAKQWEPFKRCRMKKYEEWINKCSRVTFSFNVHDQKLDGCRAQFTPPLTSVFQIYGVPSTPSEACSQYAFRFAAGVLPKLLRWPRVLKMKRSSLASLRSARQSAKAAVFLTKNGRAQVAEFAKSPGPSAPQGKETKRPAPYTTVHPPPHTLFIFPSCRSCSYLTGRPPRLPNREPKSPENRKTSRGLSV
jgi:hypothetical protein